MNEDFERKMALELAGATDQSLGCGTHILPEDAAFSQLNFQLVLDREDLELRWSLSAVVVSWTRSSLMRTVATTKDKVWIWWFVNLNLCDCFTFAWRCERVGMSLQLLFGFVISVLHYFICRWPEKKVSVMQINVAELRANLHGRGPWSEQQVNWAAAELECRPRWM